jgi:hypothetical protein
VPADGVDSDCDGTEQCYIDADGDGYRTMDGAVIASDALDCDGDGVASAAAPDTDCDDDRADVNPGHVDAAGDEVDANCDTIEYCYADADGDGYRTLDVVESIDDDCQDEGEASVDVPLVDCDDTRAGVNPGAEEIVGDGVDQDCDGTDPVSEDVEDEDVEEDVEDEEDNEDEMGDPVDSDDEADDGDAVADDGKDGCGCATTVIDPARLAWALPLFGLLGLRRRSRA